MRVGYDCIRQHDNKKMYYTNSDSSMVTGSVQLRAVRDDVMKELVWLISWYHAVLLEWIQLQNTTVRPTVGVCVPMMSLPFHAQMAFPLRNFKAHSKYNTASIINVIADRCLGAVFDLTVRKDFRRKIIPIPSPFIGGSDVPQIWFHDVSLCYAIMSLNRAHKEVKFAFSNSIPVAIALIFADWRLHQTTIRAGNAMRLE